MTTWILIFYTVAGPQPQPAEMDIATCQRLLATTRLPAACQQVGNPAVVQNNRLRLQQIKGGQRP